MEQITNSNLQSIVYGLRTTGDGLRSLVYRLWTAVYLEKRVRPFDDDNFRSDPKLHQPNHGFTLVEVLVAATIVGLLSTIGITGFQAITRSGRDAIRKSDLEQIRSALEIYKTENNAYPEISSTCVADLSSSYINSYPADPKAPTTKYCYARVTTLTYTLCAHLENGDSTTDNNCDNDAGTSNDCTLNCNYMVANP